MGDRKRPSGVGRRAIGAACLFLASVVVSGCSQPLPEADTPAAKLYAARCNSCHRVFPPSSLKFEMWKLKVDAMQGEIVRHGLPALTPEEKATLLDYLKRNSG
ncbi:MAG TPA: hypothetical protein VMT89_14955 [Candidatus Acidoferrales bacterium]|nr:hypothetical protein [Candidatus Acidoferrales bacterium]